MWVISEILKHFSGYCSPAFRSWGYSSVLFAGVSSSGQGLLFNGSSVLNGAWRGDLQVHGGSRSIYSASWSKGNFDEKPPAIFFSSFMFFPLFYVCQFWGFLKGYQGRESHTFLHFQLARETQRIHLIINKQYVSGGFAPERMPLMSELLKEERKFGWKLFFPLIWGRLQTSKVFCLRNSDYQICFDNLYFFCLGSFWKNWGQA